MIRRTSGTLHLILALVIGACVADRSGLGQGETAPPAVDLATLQKNAEGISPEGRPNNYKLGEPARIYIWHDNDGWHLRTSATQAASIRFQGTIKLHNAKFNAVRPIGLEKKSDKWTVAKDSITYEIVTAKSFDGFDFNLEADKSSLLEFETHVGNRKNLDRIFIGQKAANPKDIRFALPADP